MPGRFSDPDHRTFLEGWSTRFFTRFSTVLVTARGPLSLGTRFELPPPSEYPEGVNPIAQPSDADAVAVLERYGSDPRPDISDWSSFDERMQVIVAYFRAYQHVPTMVAFDRLPEPPARPPAIPPTA